MSVTSVVKLIREYTGTDKENDWFTDFHLKENDFLCDIQAIDMGREGYSREPPSQINTINTVLMSCFDDIIRDWQRVKGSPYGSKLGIGEPRPTYICREANLAVKLDCHCFHSKPAFPFADEVASVFCKWLHWKEIPKTVMMHQSERDHPQFNKYESYILCFSNEKYPITFTFQTAIYGTTLPLGIEKWYDWDFEGHIVSPSSFHKAYILVLLLKKGDAQGGNSMYVSKTGEIREVDNEHIGKNYYPCGGALRHFSALKKQTVAPEILTDILRVDASHLLEHLKSYTAKNKKLAALWEEEDPYSEYENLEKTFADIIKNLCGDLEILQSICEPYVRENQPVTLERIEEVFEIRTIRKNETLYDTMKEERVNFLYTRRQRLEKYMPTLIEKYLKTH